MTHRQPSNSTCSPHSWNHTPSTHIGGTWGEEEDASIVWTGVPLTNGSSVSQDSSNGSSDRMPQNGAGGHHHHPGSSWGHKSHPILPDASDPSLGWKHQQQTHQHQHQQQPPQHDMMQHHNPRPEDSLRGMNPGPQVQRSWGPNSSWGTEGPNSSQAFGPPKPHMPESVSMNGPVEPERLGTGVWGCDMMKPKPVSVEPNIGWKKESPPSSSGWEPGDKRGAPPAALLSEDRGCRDDGTAVWGNPQRQQKVSRWKEEQLLLQQQQQMQSAKSQQQQLTPTTGVTSANGSMGASHTGSGGPSSPGMIRIPPTSMPLVTSASAAGAVKPSDTWIKSQNTNQPPGVSSMNSGRNPWSEGHAAGTMQFSNHREAGGPSSGWGQGPPPDVSSSEHNSNKSRGGWGDSESASSPPGASWGKPKPNSWSDGQIDTSSWGGPKQKPLTKEMILASKQFRVLTEMGYKRDDVENALRTTNMNIEEALGMFT